MFLPLLPFSSRCVRERVARAMVWRELAFRCHLVHRVPCLGRGVCLCVNDAQDCVCWCASCRRILGRGKRPPSPSQPPSAHSTLTGRRLIARVALLDKLLSGGGKLAAATDHTGATVGKCGEGTGEEGGGAAHLYTTAMAFLQMRRRQLLEAPGPVSLLSLSRSNSLTHTLNPPTPPSSLFPSLSRPPTRSLSA